MFEASSIKIKSLVSLYIAPPFFTSRINLVLIISKQIFYIQMFIRKELWIQLQLLRLLLYCSGELNVKKVKMQKKKVAIIMALMLILHLIISRLVMHTKLITHSLQSRKDAFLFCCSHINKR